MAAALPDWMMLDRFVFRTDDDDDTSFQDDEAVPWGHGTTSQGDSFRVAFRIVEPPSVSRLYLQWSGAPKEGSSCDLVAAHRNLLLLRLTSGPVEKDGSLLVHPQDYFLCEGRRPATSPGQPPLRLHQIPICDIPLVFYLDDGRPRTAQRSVDLKSVGVLCRGEEFAVAQQLRVTRPHGIGRVHAEFCVLRSKVDSSDHSWEVEQQLPIIYDDVETSESELKNWRTDIVVPFEQSLCWVNYSLGGILLCEVFKQRPAIKYIALPTRYEPGEFDPHHRHDHVSCSCCCVCTTQDGLTFINVERGDCKLVGPLSPAAGFVIKGHILRKAEKGRMMMEWDKVFVVTSDQLWGLGFPREALVHPLANMVKQNVLYFLLSEETTNCGVDKVYLVTFDNRNKEVSMLPYITQDLEGKHAYFVERKSYLLDPFTPSELPRFLGCIPAEHRVAQQQH